MKPRPYCTIRLCVNECELVQASTNEYRQVQTSTYKYRQVDRSTDKYRRPRFTCSPYLCKPLAYLKSSVNTGAELMELKHHDDGV